MAHGDPPRVGVLGPLRRRDFRRLVLGHLSSLLGDGAFRVTIAIQVLAITPDNDPRAIALVAACWAVAQVAVLPIGGYLADRHDRRRLAVGADIARAIALGVAAWLSLSGGLELWHLCLTGVVVGASNGLFNPAAHALVPRLVPPEDLARANAFLGVARPTALWIAGPLLGAGLISLGGPGMSLAFDAVTFVMSALCIASIGAAIGAPVGRNGEVTGPGAFFTEIAGGARYVRRRTWAWAWIAASGLSTMAHSGVFEVLVPTLLIDEFAMSDEATAQVLSAVLALGGLGSVIVGTVMGQRGIPRRFMRWLLGLEAAAMVVLATYAWMTMPSWAILIGGIVFTLFTVTEIISNTLIQRLTPDRLLGRVTSLDWFTSVGLAPVGFLIAGPLGHGVGLREAILFLSIAAGLGILALACMPGLGAIERRGSLLDQPADDDDDAGPPDVPSPPADGLGPDGATLEDSADPGTTQDHDGERKGTGAPELGRGSHGTISPSEGR